MGKIFAKKRVTGKGHGRQHKKKGASRVSKKAGSGPLSSAKLDNLIARGIQKALSSGAQNERRKLTMEMNLGCDGPCPIFINTKHASDTCARIPVTAAIPAMSGSGSVSDVRRRGANKILVTGVNIRASFSVSDETRVMFFLYEPHATVREKLDLVRLSINPSPRQGLVPEGFKTVMATHYALGLVDKNGPLMTKKLGAHNVLDSVDGSPYESRVATHAGKPIGSVFRKSFGKGGLNRTVNWNQSGSGTVGAGYTAWRTELVNEYWKLNKQYTYTHEGQNDQVFEREAEMLMYVHCPSMESGDIPEALPVVGAMVRNVVVDIYYHDLS